MLTSQHIHDVIIKFQIHCFYMKLGVYCYVSWSLIMFFTVLYLLHFMTVTTTGFLSCFWNYTCVNRNEIHNSWLQECTFWRKKKNFPQPLFAIFLASSGSQFYLYEQFYFNVLIIIIIKASQTSAWLTSALVPCWRNMNIIHILQAAFGDLY